MAMALLPALAGMGQSGQGQQDQMLNAVSPGKNGQQASDQQAGVGGGVAAPSGNGGGSILQLLSLLGKGQQGSGGGMPPGSTPTTQQVPGAQTMTTGTQPTDTMGTAANGPGNGSGFGQYLMQLLSAR